MSIFGAVVTIGRYRSVRFASAAAFDRLPLLNYDPLPHRMEPERVVRFSGMEHRRRRACAGFLDQR